MLVAFERLRAVLTAFGQPEGLAESVLGPSVRLLRPLVGRLERFRARSEAARGPVCAACVTYAFVSKIKLGFLGTHWRR
eukprot:9474906-Pyramimonas_sp.AAC.1